MNKTSFPILADRIHSCLLDNGLRVYVLPRHEIKAVTVQTWVATGSIHEGEYLGCGLSHFLEHMLFQGTREYPGNAVSEQIAAFGGSLNAATSSEFTYFYINLPSERLREGLTMLDDMVREPLLPEEKFYSERDVILRELAMYKDSPVQNLFGKVREETFRMHPVRFPIGGYAERLADVTPEIMRQYHDLRYTPGRTVYVVVGDVEPEKVFDILRERTAGWARGRMDEPCLPQEPPCLFQRRARIEFPSPQAYYAASWQSPGAAHADYVPVSAFAGILGSGDSSRLYEELVNRRQLALDLLFYSEAVSAIGYSGVVAIAEPGKMKPLAEGTFDILRKFIKEGPTDEELNRLRTVQKAEYLREMQTNEGIAQMLGRSVLRFGSPDAADRYLPALDALTREDLIRVGEQYFLPEAASIVEQYPPESREHSAAVPAKIPQNIPVAFRLASGQKVICLEDHALPLANVSILLPGGLLNEKTDRHGLTRLLAETLAGGCAQYDETTFNRMLESRAIDLGIEACNTGLKISLNCPAEQLSDAVSLLCAMLPEPLFPTEIVERERVALLESLKTRQMTPMSVADSLMRETMFAGHAFGTGIAALLKSLPEIMVDELRDFYRNICLSAPCAVFGFSGALTRQDAEKLAVQLADSCKWNQFVPQAQPEPVFPTQDIRRETTLPRQQAVVLTALPGIRVSSSDMDVLGLVHADASSMASHLFQTVRNENGLVYYAGFTHQPGFGFDGCMGYYGATSTEGVPKLEKIFRDEIQRLAENGFSQEDFDNARRMMLFQLDNLRQCPGDLLSGLVSAEFTGVGWEYSWNRQKALKALTLNDFNRRLKKLFSGKAAVTAAVLPEQPQKNKE